MNVNWEQIDVVVSTQVYAFNREVKLKWPLPVNSFLTVFRKMTKRNHLFKHKLIAFSLISAKPYI